MKLLQMPARELCLVLRASEEAPRGFSEQHSPWAIYRNHTVVLLRKYFRMSLEIGRMPSLLGGELFRAKVTTYQVHTFEDTVIFVHDMEQCLEKLDPLSKLLIGRVILQDFTREEVAAQLRVHERHLRRRLQEGLDRLTRILLRVGLLDTTWAAEAEGKKEPESSETVCETKGFEMPQSGKL
jgi:hypothetical protein